MLRKTVVLTLAMVIASFAFGNGVESPGQGADTSVVKVLRTTNKAQVNRYVCAALEFKHINPFNVINFLWAPLSREEGGIYSYVPPDAKNGYVVVICPEYQLETLRNIARELDRPGLNSAPGSAYIYHRLKHRNVTNPGFLGVADYYRGVSGLLVPDVETNSLLIFDAPEGARAAQEAFNDILDKPLAQVELKVKVYEISARNDGTLGLDYEAWKNGPGRLLGQTMSHGEYFKFKGMVEMARNTGHGRGMYLDYPSAFFDFLVQQGQASVMTDTKVVVTNRTPALLTAGEQIVYRRVATLPDSGERGLVGEVATLTDPGLAFPLSGRKTVTGNMRAPFVPGAPIVSQIGSVEAGLWLGVVPTIGDDTISIDVDLRLVNNLGFDGAGVPILATRRMNSSIAVPMGEETVFGGLVREQKIQTTRKVPILGSIPVLGYLFGGEVTTCKKGVVVASVTPRLVASDEGVGESDDRIACEALGEPVVVEY